jgi:hypothetical protein
MGRPWWVRSIHFSAFWQDSTSEAGSSGEYESEQQAMAHDALERSDGTSPATSPPVKGRHDQKRGYCRATSTTPPRAALDQGQAWRAPARSILRDDRGTHCQRGCGGPPDRP